jgi:predicted RND superfamily exporter protein
MASLIAVVGVTLLYFGLFKGVVRPLLALGTLLIAVCWSLGLTTLTVGHLNIFSIAFMPMLLGLGIDYGSYFIARFEEEQAATSGMQQALIRTFATTGPGVVATALTTAFTFGTLLLPGFKGIAELGFIGGSSILLTLLATFTVLPALLVWHERHRRVGTTSQTRPRAGDRGGYLAILYRYPRASLAAGGLLVGLSCLFIGRVGADFNLLHLQRRSWPCCKRTYRRAR